MKNVLLIMLILFSTNCFGQEITNDEIINVNYSKYLKISAIYFDKNQSKKTDYSEFNSLDNGSIDNGSMVLKYKDFGSAGNILNVIININNKIKFKKKYQDIILYRVDNDGINYAARNKYNEILFMIIAESNESKDYYLEIDDLTILL